MNEERDLEAEGHYEDAGMYDESQIQGVPLDPDYLDYLSEAEEYELAKEEYYHNHGTCEWCGGEWGEGWSNCTCEIEVEEGDMQILWQYKRVALLFAWYDFWIGTYYDRHHRWLYVALVPMVLVRLDFGRRPLHGVEAEEE